jgi:hypothetical protein
LQEQWNEKRTGLGALPVQATVEEALWFSARLRLARDISNARMWAFIHEARCFLFLSLRQAPLQPHLLS